MNATQERINYYALLSRVMMHECDLDMMEKILANDEMLLTMPNLKNEKEIIQEDPERFIGEILNVDFTNMFLLHLTPYESFFRREDAMMNTGGTNPVIQYYEKYEFQVDLGESRTISPDQLGCELEFMHMLVDSQRKALENDDKESIKELLRIQAEFMKEHLMTWAPLFLMQLKKYSETGFYRDFADLTLDFLWADNEYILEQSA
jgi:TorA maturation chaperone TorD